jgi:hypothetical protein
MESTASVVYPVHNQNEPDRNRLPPELTEDEELQVAIRISTEEEKRAFPGLEDALFLSVAPPPPPRRQPPPSPTREPPRPGHAEADEAWDPPVAQSRRSGDRLANSTATPATRTSPSTHGGLVVATRALHRPHPRSMKTTTTFRRTTTAPAQP